MIRGLMTVSGMTLVSRILGFIRDVVIARVFGAGYYTDAFFVAFRFPNLLRRLFAEGAFTQAFVPVLSEYKTTCSKEETQELISQVATLLGAIMIVISLLGVMAAPWIVYVCAPGFSMHTEKFQLTVNLLRITFPYILFISLTAFAGGILNTWSRFAIPAIAPALLNICFIVAAVWVAPLFEPPVMVLAWAVLAGGLLQLLLQLPFLKRIGFFPKFNWKPRATGVRRVLTLMGPAVFGVSIAQISLLLNTIFASFLENGSVSWLYYADRLMELPMGLLGATLATVLLPGLSKSVSQQNEVEYSNLLDYGLRITILLVTPCAVILAFFGGPIISTLFLYGEFTENDVLMTQKALEAYSVGIIALVFVRILAPGFYARQNTKTPVKIAIVSLCATQIMNIIFIWYLKHVGLALSISLAAWINAGLLFFYLRRAYSFNLKPGWFLFLFKTGVAVSVMFLVLLYFNRGQLEWADYGYVDRAWKLFSILSGAGFAYGAILWLMGLRFSDLRFSSTEERC